MANLELKKWRPLSEVTSGTESEIRDYHQQLYGTHVIPKTWVFNDFGHRTCYFYRDRNRNGKRDPGERVHPEFFHTTPDDEADEAAGRDVTLSESHGCIHLKPVDIDELVKAGHMKRNTKVVIHRYDVKVPRFPRIPTAA